MRGSRLALWAGGSFLATDSPRNAESWWVDRVRVRGRLALSSPCHPLRLRGAVSLVRYAAGSEELCAPLGLEEAPQPPRVACPLKALPASSDPDANRKEMRVLVLTLCAAAAQAQRGYDPASQRYQEEVRCASSPRPIKAPRF